MLKTLLQTESQAACLSERAAGRQNFAEGCRLLVAVVAAVFESDAVSQIGQSAPEESVSAEIPQRC